MEASPRRRLARSSSSGSSSSSASKPPPPPARDEYGPEPEPEPEVRYDEEEGSADGARPYTAIEEEAAEDGEGAAMPGLASNGAGLKLTTAAGRDTPDLRYDSAGSDGGTRPTTAIDEDEGADMLAGLQTSAPPSPVREPSRGLPTYTFTGAPPTPDSPGFGAMRRGYFSQDDDEVDEMLDYNYDEAMSSPVGTMRYPMVRAAPAVVCDGG